MKTKAIEYVWSGYRSSQRRPCHRVITRRKATLDKYKTIAGIAFTDGTNMSLAVRDAVRGEQPIHGYDKLFDNIFAKGLTGYIHVDQLTDRDP